MVVYTNYAAEEKLISDLAEWQKETETEPPYYRFVARFLLFNN
ncbi:hypothetical protein QY97_00534 [Bacillus thermotolerans]|nr:hypothetical protein QY97_00534 [Bacillus thermotolerans]